jgi:integrase
MRHCCGIRRFAARRISSYNSSMACVIVRLLMLTGQRREEVGGMRWAELDLDRAVWTLPGPQTKSRQAHQVPLSRQAVALLQPRERNRRALVFGEARAASVARCMRRRRRGRRRGRTTWSGRPARIPEPTPQVRVLRLAKAVRSRLWASDRPV